MGELPLVEEGDNTRMRPECRYGHLCQRENPDHWRIFSHPAMPNGPESTGTELKHEQSLVYCDKQLPLVHNNVPDETATNSSTDNSTNVLLMLVGLPGSGKSTFCTRLLQSRASKWRRICQDIISKGKRGSKEQCLKLAEKALNQGLSVMIDRCNLTKDQRHEFVELARRFHVKAEALVLDLPVRSCIQRAVQRTGHEGGLQGKGAPAVIQNMARHKELPSKIEGFSSIVTCHTDGDVEQAFGLYQQSSEMGDQARYDISHIQLSGNVGEKISSGVEQGERESRSEQGLSTCVGEGTRTLAFPSISTSDFHFDHERAAEIIIETASDFLLKFKQYGLRLILVDLKEDSSMLVRVRQKAATCGLRPEEFLAIAGDITKLHSSCGLHCNFIANATNWRLKAGGGGVNAAIFKAAGNELEIETKTRATTLNPGSALAVPLPATSPLYVTEGVTHVIHVLGPNMNPQRPSCLQGDYDKGCKILRDAYSCMFQAFASAVESQGLEGPIGQSSLSSGTATTDAVKTKPLNAFAILMQSAKRKFVNAGSDQKAKHGRQDRDPKDASPSGATEVKHNVSDRRDPVVSGSSLPEHGNAESINASGSYGKVGVFQGESHKLGTSHDNEGLKSKKWEPWAEALRKIVLHPEEHKDIILQVTQEAILIVDKFPKGRKHFLVVSRQDGLDSIEDLRSSHLLLLQHMHTLGQTWVQSLLDQEQSLQFRMGYHSLEIEAGRVAQVPRAERICRLCREEVETEDHFVCRCRAHQGVRDRYAGLFEEHSSLHQLMEASDQRQLGRLLLELHSSRERLLQTPAPTRGGRQSQLTDFFQRAMPVPADVPRGVTAQRAEELRARRRPRQTGHRAPRLRHREIAAIRMRHQMETQERLARFHSDSGYMFMPFTASASAMYDILYPSYGTGWS